MRAGSLRTFAAFALGAAVSGFVLTNPFGWGWMERSKREHTPSSTMQDPAGSLSESGRRIKYWQAPMDPTYVRNAPGKSPMGMDLIPVYEDQGDVADEPGAVHIDPVFVQNIGVQSEPVRRQDIPIVIRTVGSLDYDDERMAWVNTKYEGWIETAYVNFVGEEVQKGQKLFEIYSPGLVTTQKEYLQAVDYAERIGNASHPEIAARAQALVEASLERLALWDVSAEQIRELETTRELRRTLAVSAPVSGVVVEKMDEALEGMFVKAGMNLYKIADLSTLWLEAEVYQHQMRWLRVGTAASVVLGERHGETATGRIRFMSPSFDEKTRTMRISVELPNPGGRLKADMYANVTFHVPAVRDALVVPEEAVLHSGERSLVVLDQGEGRFQVAEITLGINSDGLWEVTDGVQDGDRIVVSSQFLIDSESNLKEAIRKLVGRGTGASNDAASPPSPEAQRDHAHH